MVHQLATEACSICIFGAILLVFSILVPPHLQSECFLGRRSGTSQLQGACTHAVEARASDVKQRKTHSDCAVGVSPYSAEP